MHTSQHQPQDDSGQTRATTDQPINPPCDAQRAAAMRNLPDPATPRSTPSHTEQAASMETRAMEATGPKNVTAPQAPIAEPCEPIAGSSRQTTKPGTRSNRRALIGAGIAVGIVAVLYLGGALAFSNIYYPGTTIAGVDVSLMGRDAAKSRVEASAQSYTLAVDGNDFSWTYSAKDSGLPVDVAKWADSLIKENEPFAWPFKLAEALAGQGGEGAAAASPQDPAPGFDEAAFDTSFAQAVEAYNEGRSGTFDAPSAYDEEQGIFTLERAKTNVKLNYEPALKHVKEALFKLESSVQLDASDFATLGGDATDEQLEAACKAANELIGTNVDIKMEGHSVAKLGGKELAAWIVFDENLKPSLDLESVTAWAYELDDDLDTAGSERTYTRPDGKVVTVGGGNYGWIVDSAGLAKAIEQAVANKQTGDLVVPLKSKGAVYTKPGEKDWAEYVDIDLSEQHARYYDANGALQWESGCITGNPNLGNETPTGIYRMNSCGTNIVLVGKKDPETGEPEYKTPVKYWMPFVGQAIGLHDASWQAASNFSNPNAYKSVGSHGCINLPPEKAAELYGLIKEGICVIVHW